MFDMTFNMHFLRLQVMLSVMIACSRGLSLSELPHEVDGKHNEHYDHEVFLGKDNAAEFEQLTEEESKRRLGLIVDKIDKDDDDKVSEVELADWIWYIRTSFVANDTNQIWIQLDHEDGQLTWENYLRKTFGHYHENPESPHSPLYKYRARVKEEKRRWGLADLNSDSVLTKTEFMYFVHPEESKHTKDVIVLEYSEKLDRNGDGKIDIEEFVMDINSHDPRTQTQQWKDLRRQEFGQRDKNKNGVLDFEEMKEWISPENYNPAKAEAHHLINHADTDKDGVLTKAEIINSFNLFVGSQALDYGDVLKKHDEF
ncbi:calumenin-A-like isoform X2 [Argopecten irradians]|uniref:calumenin-A-like isoform X2 n=1 Tax=Argopecten irradians TaxID=31199 RepID=UPI0037111B36